MKNIAFTHLWVKGFGWENTVYVAEDFVSVKQIGADVPADSIFIATDDPIFIATDKNGTEYLLKGVLVPDSIIPEWLSNPKWTVEKVKTPDGAMWRFTCSGEYELNLTPTAGL